MEPTILIVVGGILVVVALLVTAIPAHRAPPRLTRTSRLPPFEGPSGHRCWQRPDTVCAIVLWRCHCTDVSLPQRRGIAEDKQSGFLGKTVRSQLTIHGRAGDSRRKLWAAVDMPGLLQHSLGSRHLIHLSLVIWAQLLLTVDSCAGPREFPTFLARW